jgi:outer membrane protein assembly factor BamB
MKDCMISILLTLVLMVAVLNPASSFSLEENKFTNWPLHLMDAQNTAFTTATIPNNMEYTNVLPISGSHAPIVAEDCCFLINSDSKKKNNGAVHCYDIETEKLIWKKQYSALSDHEDEYKEELRAGNCMAYSSITKQIILMETITGDWLEKRDFFSRFYVLNPKNGNIVWQLDIEGYYSNSIIVEGAYAYLKLIKITRDGDHCNYRSREHCIYKIDLQLREVVWSRFYLRGGCAYWYQSCISVHETYIVSVGVLCIAHSGKLIITQEPCFISLIDKNSGEIADIMAIWNYVTVSTPIVMKNRIFMAAVESRNDKLDFPNYLLSFEIQENKLKSFKNYRLSKEDHDHGYAVNLAFNNGKIFSLDYCGLLICFSTESGEKIWEKNIGKKSNFGPYFCTEKYLIICSKFSGRYEDKREDFIVLQYIDPDSGEVLFENPVPFDGYPPSEVTGTDNHIWAKCGEKIAHFSPVVPITITVEPENIYEVCGEDDDKLITCKINIYTTGRISGRISCEDEWIVLSNKKISKATDYVNVRLITKNRNIGIHHATVVFDTNVGVIKVPVTLEILQNPILEVNPLQIEHEILEGEYIQDTVLSIKNVGGQELIGSIDCEDEWVVLSTRKFDNKTKKVTVSFKNINKKYGLYESEIIFNSNGGEIKVPIVITVKQNPSLDVEPKEIIEQIALGSHTFAKLTLKNIGGDGLKGTIKSDQDWLVPHFDGYNDDTKEVNVTLNAKNLKAGNYHGNVIFTGNNQVIKVPVTLKCILWITFRIGSKTVKVNEVKQTIISAPYLFEKRSYVPVRKLVESLPLVNYVKNAEMKWDPIERKVTIYVNEETIELWVDDPMAKINNTDTPIDPDNSSIAPQIRNGRTFLPLRFVSETLGYTVEWVASTKTIHLKYIVKEE